MKLLALALLLLAAAAPIARLSHTDWRDLARRALVAPVESCPRPVVKSLRGRRVVLAEMPARPKPYVGTNSGV
ncbi:hypothetical protein Q8F55_003357 [Vanrija albida]|uniref:Uncharacterized protein n=1 Tax=Vanrija albida TaxID=181172 RepID=A0ABR3Q3R6_9TREE